jgi:hypothetical protein
LDFIFGDNIGDVAPRGVVCLDEDPPGRKLLGEKGAKESFSFNGEYLGVKMPSGATYVTGLTAVFIKSTTLSARSFSFLALRCSADSRFSFKVPKS